MADQNKLHIRLHVYDEEIEVVINREDEEFYRLASPNVIMLMPRHTKDVKVSIQYR